MRIPPVQLRANGASQVASRQPGHAYIQVKEARTSVLEPYVSHGHYRHQGERVVTGQRIRVAAETGV